MEGGTYARALEAGFNKKQATFFSHFSIDLKNETIQRMNEEVKNIELKYSRRNRLAAWLRKLADNISKTN